MVFLKNLKGLFVLLLVILNTIIIGIPLIFACLIKLIPNLFIQSRMTIVIELISFIWMNINLFITSIFLPIKFNIKGMKDFDKKDSYLIVANHQSWTDIMVLQNVFLGKISFAKFFLKNELKWIPILGLAWWGMDFPFMKRYSKDYLNKHPEKKGKDLEATRNACNKFKNKSLTLVNFSEGTRYSASKAKKSNSIYKNLLPPKAGGVFLVMDILGEKISKILDVTIHYPKNTISMWDYLSGNMPSVNVNINVIEVTEEILVNMKNDKNRTYTRNFMNDIWYKKDIQMNEFNFKKIK